MHGKADRGKDIIQHAVYAQTTGQWDQCKKEGGGTKFLKKEKKAKKERKEQGENQTLERVEIDIKKGWTPETGGEVGVTNISDKKVRLRQERT